jgi:hypothetical protein
MSLVLLKVGLVIRGSPRLVESGTPLRTIRVYAELGRAAINGTQMIVGVWGATEQLTHLS